MLRIEGARIAVPDTSEARAAYSLVLGCEPVERPDGALRFQLVRGAVELVQGDPGLAGLLVASDAPVPPQAHGVPLYAVASTADERPTLPAGPGARAIDHVVVQTVLPERAIAFWLDGGGLRLALDRTFPERGLRLQFFRSAGMTLEYASPHPRADGVDAPDRLHGVSYRVGDLGAHRAALLAAGVDVSELRTGMRPGTRVATVRAGTGGVPTLLLEVTDPPPRAA